MAIYLRGGKYYVKIKGPNGATIRRTTGTSNKREAQEYHDTLKADLWRQSRLKVKPRVTWADAVVRWADEKGGKKSFRSDLAKIRALDPALGGKWLDQITRDIMDQIVQNMTPATANRYTAFVRAVLRAAEREWGWLDKAPILRMQTEPSRRVRWITRSDAARLISELPDHLAALVRFSLATGVRAANATGLRWDQVDLVRRVAWVNAAEAKSGKALAIPLNAEAIDVIRQQLGRHQIWVFTYQGRRIIQCNTRAWRKALSKCGIEDFRWHDLRHTWASWHIQSGTPLGVLQELGGWEKLDMVRRYAHLSADALAAHAENVGTVLDTPQNDNIRKMR